MCVRTTKKCMSLQWFAEWYVNLHRKKEPMRHRQLPLKQTRINFTVAHLSLSLCVDIEMAVCFQRVQISHKHNKIEKRKRLIR